MTFRRWTNQAIRRARRGIPPAVWLAFLLPLCFWGRFLFSRETLFYDTIFRLFFPYAIFFRQCLLRQHQFPFWNPYIYSGVPFMANLQSAAFYPFTYLYLFLDFSEGYVVSLLLHTTIAFLCMWLLAREYRFSEESAVLSAIIFSFNGFFIQHYAYGSHFNSYVWLPLVILFFQRSRGPEKVKYAGLTAAVLALQFLGGYPQFVYYTGLILCLHAVWDAANPHSLRETLQRLLGLVLIGLLAALLCAVQLYPSILLALESPRAAIKGYEWAMTYSIKPIEMLFMFFAPLWNQYYAPGGGDPHILGFYFGWPVLSLVFWAFRYACRFKRFARLYGTLSILGILMAMGGYLPIFHALHDYFPGARFFRFPAQAMYMSCFAMALLAGAGLDQAQRGSRTRWLIVSLCLVDLWAFGQRSIETMDRRFFNTKTQTVRFLAGHSVQARIVLTPRTRSVGSRRGRTRLEAALKFRDSLYPNLGMVDGIQDADGYEELRYARYDLILDQLARTPNSPWMDLLGIRYILSLWKDLPRRYRLALRSSVFVFESPSFFPKAYLVPKAIYVADDRLPSYMAGKSSLDLSRVVILSEPPPLFGKPAQPAGRRPVVEVVKYTPNDVVVEVDSDSGGWLVLIDAYDKGWRATLNGTDTKIYRANFICRAVAVGGGVGRVRFHYQPLFFPLLSVLSLGSFLAVCVAAV